MEKEKIEGQVCNDNRFDLIEKAKQRLIKATNIETSPEEMKVLDSILFRFWQMGWLENNNENYETLKERLENKQKQLLRDIRYDYEKLAELKESLNYYNKEGWQINAIIRDIECCCSYINGQHYKLIKQIEDIENLLHNSLPNQELILTTENVRSFVLGSYEYLVFKDHSNIVVAYAKQFKDLKFDKIENIIKEEKEDIIKEEK